LEEFNNKHYPKIHFAFDGSRNMYTTKEIKGVGMFIILILKIYLLENHKLKLIND